LCNPLQLYEKAEQEKAEQERAEQAKAEEAKAEQAKASASAVAAVGDDDQVSADNWQRYLQLRQFKQQITDGRWSPLLMFFLTFLFI
jgi:hypothetical protein